MNKLSKDTQRQIKAYRKNGYTHRQIAELLRVSLGSAAHYSKRIKLTELQKKHINERNYQKSLGKISHEKRVIASKKGGLNSPNHFIQKYTRKQIIQIIRDFKKRNGRIPIKKDYVGLYRAVLRIFGTWNSAIQAAGLPINPILFSKKHIANDGHKCDSLAEKIIDDWFSSRKIFHERNVKYGNTRFTSDFKVNNTYIEFFGLQGQLKSYDLLMSKKKILVRKLGIRLISLYPQDLFPKSRLDQVFADLYI